MIDSFNLYVESLPPPGMEEWIASNTMAFINQYGDDYQPYLLSAAWTEYRRRWRDPEVFSQ